MPRYKKQLQTKRTLRNTRVERERNEADALEAVALGRSRTRAQQAHPLDFDSDSSSDDQSSSSSSEDTYDVDLDRIFSQQRPRGSIASRFEIESLVRVGKKRDEVVIQERKKSNALLVLSLTLLVVCAVLLYDRKNLFDSAKTRTGFDATSDKNGNKNSGKISVYGNNDGKHSNELASKSQLEKYQESISNYYNDDNDDEEDDDNGYGDEIDMESSDTSSQSSSSVSSSQLNSKTETYHDNSAIDMEDISEDYKKEMAFTSKIEQAFQSLSPCVVWNLPYDHTKDVPVFWRIPLVGGTAVENIMGQCIGLVEASGVGISYGHENDASLQIFRVPDRGQYVNVDTTTPAGIQRAGKMGLVQANLADVITSPYLYETVHLFHSTNHKAKCFTMIRHPISRGISTFYNLQYTARAQPTAKTNAFQDMNIEEYARGPFCEDNWMVRFLTNEMEEPLTRNHLELAKEVLGRKCLVGLLDEFEESMKRFDSYFGWSEKLVERGGNSELKKQCTTQLIQQRENLEEYPNFAKGSTVWELFKMKNMYDLELYEYAKDLFHKQALYG